MRMKRIKNWIFAPIYYKYDVGNMSYSIKDEKWISYLRLRNNRIFFKIEINMRDIEKSGKYTCVFNECDN